MNLESKLKQFDQEIDNLLIEPLAEIEIKSKALSLSLKRCFEDARQSKRFEAAFQTGLEKKLEDKEINDLLNELIKPFENEDFEIFREFVRLLRACSLHIGGNISKQIRECYNKTFKEDRVLLAYSCGIEESKLKSRHGVADLNYLIKLFREKRELNEDTVKQFISVLSDCKTTDEELAAITVAWKSKGETAKELALIAKYVLGKIETVNVGFDVVDCCGTGGDNSGTFNISTTSAFLAAACGLKVAKHGGRKTTSSSGSVDFLDALKVATVSEAKEIKKQLENKGLVFIASPVTQKLLGRWKGVCRKLELFGQTGLIGTLTNPVNLSHQILGVPKAEWGPLMLESLKILGRQNALVIHGHPQMDEASLCGKTQIWTLKNGQTDYLELEPKDLGLEESYSLKELVGGTPEENAQIFYQLLNEQQPKPIFDTVCFNTALILWLCGKTNSVQAGMKECVEAIESGRVKDYLRSL